MGGGSNREARIIKVTNRMVFVHSFTGSSTYNDVHTHLPEAVSDWLNPLSLGTMSASRYIENLA